ncbi:hypothetical protein HanXRQr2_Chr09g0388981 [Helianthus annuus]|uniref:Uncharacterized protein n=1 Tax=Helianthus annuus TaxID=4232 RepID=A0A9K3I6C3_HELAN|nr:hypothetical protein HanXRQr2_Chr09g0388981 [Helianthus annuus]KAJ0893192.1 hypothetical protein HanPSC8_Chr09g0374841 [Helianthus annuus]
MVIVIFQYAMFGDAMRKGKGISGGQKEKMVTSAIYAYSTWSIHQPYLDASMVVCRGDDSWSNKSVVMLILSGAINQSEPYVGQCGIWTYDTYD